MVQRSFLLLAALLSGCASAKAQTLPPAPVPPTIPPRPTAAIAAHLSTLASRCGPCKTVQSQATIGGTLYIGCDPGRIVALSGNGKLLATNDLGMSFITAILPAGNNVIVVSGVNDGAALVNTLSFLRARTLRQVTLERLADTTYLGTIGDRAYLDDWCCFGRPNAYQPATIYSISLKDGTASARVDLTPDPQSHPADQQPLGQGEHNYLIGHDFYVVVGPVTYRYDVRRLNAEPTRMRSVVPGP
jgi:hypothetical protein